MARFSFWKVSIPFRVVAHDSVRPSSAAAILLFLAVSYVTSRTASAQGLGIAIWLALVWGYVAVARTSGARGRIENRRCGPSA